MARVKILTLLVLIAVSPVIADQWPEFRGPGGMGHSTATGLPTEWSEQKNIVWKTEIPGTGWSSPVVWDDQIWITTSTVENVSEDVQAAAADGKPFPVAAAKNLKMYAVCVHKDTGELLHKILLLKEPQPDAIHTMNSFASPTPVIRAGRVFCHFGNNGTACIDTELGEVVWSHRDLPLNHSTGAGSSPLLWNNLLIVHCDGIDVQYIAALDTETGETVWKTDRSGELNATPEFKKAFSTPVMLTLEGHETLISSASDYVYAYDPTTGEELWNVPYGMLGFSTTPRPVVGNGFIYVCTGFMKSRLLALKYDPQQRAKAPTIAWDFDKQVPTITSPIVVNDTIYFVSESGGVLTALDAITGEKRWQERLGGNYAASPLFADGHVYFFSRDGIATVLKPSGPFEIVSENELDGSFMASPAVTDNALILRTDKAVYRVQNIN
jgi:outer membrane protein assembly factor BamB